MSAGENNSGGFEVAEPSLEGEVLEGRYRIRERLGRGGMGAVYRAEHVSLGRECAVKVLLPKYTSHETAIKRFRREARAACRVNHDNVVEIYDTGQTEDGLGYIAMELLRGENLAATLRRERRLPWSRVKHIVLQICRALAAAHAQGIVHRDMKPDNCFRVNRHGDPDFIKILDFGIAKLTSSEQEGSTRLTASDSVVGTYSYMSYEQVCGLPCDHRIDIWATGVIVYELITGALPFRGINSGQIWAAIVQSEPIPMSSALPHAGIPAALDAVVLKALAKNPSQRFRTIVEFASALAEVPDEDFFEGSPNSAGTSPPYSSSGTKGFDPIGATAYATPGKHRKVLPLSQLQPTEGQRVDPHAETAYHSAPAMTDTDEAGTNGVATDPFIHAPTSVSTPTVSGQMGGGAAPESPLAEEAQRRAIWRVSVVAIPLVLAGLAGGVYWMTSGDDQVDPGLVVASANEATVDNDLASKHPQQLEGEEKPPDPELQPLPSVDVEADDSGAEKSSVSDEAQPLDAGEGDEIETTKAKSSAPPSSPAKKKKKKKKTVSAPKNSHPPSEKKTVSLPYTTKVFKVLQSINRNAGKRCLVDKGGSSDKVKVTVSVDSATGRVISAKPSALYAGGSPLGNCIVKAIKGATFPKDPEESDVTRVFTFKL